MTRPSRPLHRPRRSALLAAALVVLLVAAGTVAGVSGTRVLERRAAEERRAEVVEDASRVAVDFTTLDHRTFDEDVQRVLDGSTGAFRDQFAAGIDQTRQLVTENESVSVGAVSSAAVVTSDDDSARVVVVVDAEVSNVSSPTPAARHYRVQLDMSRTGDRWLAGDLTFVG